MYGEGRTPVEGSVLNRHRSKGRQPRMTCVQIGMPISMTPVEGSDLDGMSDPQGVVYIM